MANSQRQGLLDMRYECSIRQLLLEIGAVRELSRKEDSALEETEVLEIQKAVLAGTYTFSPFRIVVCFEERRSSPSRDKFFAFVERLPDHLLFKHASDLVRSRLGSSMDLIWFPIPMPGCPRRFGLVFRISFRFVRGCCVRCSCPVKAQCN